MGGATLAAASAVKRRVAAPIRGSHSRPDGVERPPERRVEAAREPLDALRLEEDAARARGLDREPGVLEPAQERLPRLLRPGRVRLERGRATGHVASASESRIPAWTPSASAAEVARPDERLRAGLRRERHGPSRSSGRSRSAARSEKTGMERQAIMGTYVLHEHVFPCK